MIINPLKKTYLAATAAVCFACFSNIALAADEGSLTDPNHVFQETKNMLLELDGMHKVNKSKPKEVVIEISPRKPRHVFQKAREVYYDVQKLRQLKGLAVNALPDLPVRDVSPKDVKALMDTMLADIDGLRAKYGTKLPASAKLPSGKKPSDVYANLIKIKGSIAGLGVSAVAPSDVYRVTLSVVSDLKEMAAKKGAAPIAKIAPSSGKKPKDVYAASYELIKQLKKLSETNKISIPGGVMIPAYVKREHTPAEVIDLVNDVLAEVGAIKHASGLRTPTKLAPEQSGKVPSNVYDQIITAQAIVKTMM